MPKKIYIIEAKLSSETVNYLTEILERRSKEYRRVFACTIADYIVTELKSPSRIIRNVKKSTCPVLNIKWLFESLRSEKPLNITDYVIDVTEERKKMALELSLRVDRSALPQQLTWEEVSDRRLNRSNQIYGKNIKLVKNSALQERNLFMRSYGGRYNTNATSSSQPVYNLSLNKVEFPFRKSSMDDCREEIIKVEESTTPLELMLHDSNAEKFNSSSMPMKKLGNSRSASTHLESDLVGRSPLVCKKLNSSLSALISSQKKIKQETCEKGHCSSSSLINSVATENNGSKVIDTKDEIDFSIVTTTSNSSHEENHQLLRDMHACASEESNNHAKSTASDIRDGSYNSISSIDSQFSISNLLSL